jgi:lysozyme
MSKIRVVASSLALSAAGLVGLVLHEGYTDKAIQPLPGDKWTVGFGTTGGVRPGDRVTPPQALARALRDVQQFEGALKACVTVPLTQSEYDVYVDFSYNIGSAAFCRSTLVARLNAKDYDGACAELSRWTMFKGKDCRDPANKCRGLVDRRAVARAKCEAP